MLIKKRGFCKSILFFLVLTLLSVAISGADQTGYCSNPIMQGICEDSSIAKSDCCPESFDGYGAQGYPSSKEDCENNYFGSDVSSLNNCQMGSCFIQNEELCQETSFSECYYMGGTPSSDPINENPLCQKGCCCYTDQQQQSVISTQDYCDRKTDSTFNTDITESAACSSECGVDEADDGDSNDDTGDDGDAGETSSCGSMPYCQIQGPLTGTCCCDGTVCEPDDYCCQGSCYAVPCDDVCERSEPCGTENDEGCPLFKKCFANGSLADECTPRPSCGNNFEVCDTPEDENNNGEVNCEEAFCNGMVCARDDSEKSTNCPTNSYYDFSNNVYRCCYGLELNDCDDQPGPDTCGECDCLKMPRAPILDPILVNQGENGVELRWHLNCEGIKYRLMRCEGEGCENNVYNLRSETEKLSFFDNGIEPNTKYCYYVNAIYPDSGAEGTTIKKSEKQCFTSGDSVCMQIPERSFCLDENNGFSGKLVKRVTCTANNTLFEQENCQQSRGENYVCQGPFPGKGTMCVFQSPCHDCGNPFGIFADYATSSTEMEQNSEGFCKTAPTCYFDYTETSVDNFHDCSSVQTCYDYKSEFACTGQPSANLGANNKCLPRDCEWKSIQGSPTGGICMEKSAAFMDCENCNEAEYNHILGACDVDTCSQFGQCYLRSSADYKCVSSDRISCKDYQTNEECTGGKELDINVEYDDLGSRVSGTNEIETPSGDSLGFGVCRWDPSRGNSCFKDADFDSFPDPSGGKLTFDMTPPNTTILSPTQTRDLNITFEVTDYNPDGSKGSGVHNWNVYFCKTKANEEPCYPDQTPEEFNNNRGWVNLGGGSGTYNVYYYAQDKAANLEEIKKEQFTIDMSAPKIDISFSVQEDTDEYIDSKISFLVNTSESAHCWDYFEDNPDHQMTGDAWGDKWTTLYSGLTDGHYQYKVVCEDRAGNTGEEIVTVRVNADAFIDKTYPTGKLDYSDVILKVDTLESTNCKWGPEEKSYNTLPHTFSNMEEVSGYYQHSASFTAEESKTYSFDVKCRDGNRISDDEIQFVYDNESPTTEVIDINNNEFDFTSWYSGSATEDKLFLRCNDTPENGFGCDKTFYCVNYNNEFCTPNQEIAPDEPLQADFSQADKFRICYRSKEKTIDGMGGKFETSVCREMQIDTNPPYITVENLNAYKEPSSPKQVNKRFYTLVGEVIDPDVVNDVSDNTLDIIVEHKKSGNTSVYEDIPANSDFTQEIELEEELNVITLFATDRSGAESGPVKYYIFYSPYEGDMIALSRPAFGISSSPKFIFEVETYGEAECKYSLTGSKAEAIAMTPYTDQNKNLHKTNDKVDLSWLAPGSKQSVTVFCNFRGYDMSQEFDLGWDNTRPRIEDIYIERGIDRNPPTLVEYPLETNLVVETDDETICKYTDDAGHSYYNTNQNLFPGYDTFNFSTTNKVLLDELTDKTTYEYYIQCENAVTDESIRLSKRERFRFKVDTSLNTGIKLLAPEDPTTKTSFSVHIETSKTASWCRINYNGTEHNMTNDIGNEFSSPIFNNVEQGDNRFEVSCLTAGEHVTDSFKILVDNTPPGKPKIDDGNQSIRLDSLSATWDAEDSETDIELYKYAIGSMPGSTDVLEWANTSDDDSKVDDLNLTEGETYYWMVKAQNEVGLWGEANVSDGVYAGEIGDDITQPSVDNCSNGVLDGDETGVDCGGPDCPSCSFNASCSLDSDCASGNCENGLCAEPTCSDNITNQDETDVDCGGSCDPCAIGKGCEFDDDCKSGFCKYSECFEATCSDGFQNQGEEGTDCGGPCNTTCESAEENATCQAQYGPMAGKLDTDCDGIPDEWEIKYSEVLNLHNNGDAIQDPDGDGRTNLEEYKDGTNPTKAEEKTEEGSSWLLILIIIFVILALMVALVVSYKYFYYKIPPEYRKYTDVVVQPIASWLKQAQDKTVDLLDKSGIMPYIRKAKDSIMGMMGKPPMENYQQHAGSMPRKSASFTGSAKDKGLSQAKPKEVTVDNAGYENANNTKELVDQIRKKRQMEKQKQRENVVSSFDQKKGKKKVKRKDLLDKVSQAFDKSNKKK